MSLGQSLRRLDARFAPPGPVLPGPPVKRGWVVAAVGLGVATLSLLIASVVANAVLAFLLAPVGIVYGWVMGRLYESRVAATGRGVSRSN